MAKKRRFADTFPNPEDPTAELIKRRRLQMLIHSCLYYELNTELISDAQFDAWALALAELLSKHSNVYSDRFDQYFEDWTGDTGMHFNHRDPWVLNKAEYLVALHNKRNDVQLG